MQLSDFSKRQWQRMTFASALLGGALAGTLGWSVSAAMPLLSGALGFVVGSAVFGLLITFISSVNEKLNNVLRRVNESENELQAMVNVRPLLGNALVSYGGWAMSAHLAETVARFIMEEQPELIVECGSGSSTVLMSSCLEKLGGDRSIFSLDHEPEYADVTRQQLERNDLSEWADVQTAPLRSWQVDGRALPWYGFDLDALPDKPIDMIVVDGPPGVNDPEARYPAVPVLHEHLASDCVVVLDDGDRPGERETAHRWAEKMGGKLEYGGGAKGVWVLRRDDVDTVLS